MIINIMEFIKSILKWLLCLVFLSGLTFAEAQQTDSLSGYLKQAALSNPGLKAKYLQYQAALEKVPQAGTLPDPELQFGFFLNKMELMEGYQLADFRLMQMAPWFGSLKAAKDEASKMALARFQEVESLKNDIFLQVKISWYELFKTKREIKSAEKSLLLLKTLERLALSRIRTDGNTASAAAGGMQAFAESFQKSGVSSMTGTSMGNQAAGAETDSKPMPASTNGQMNSSSQIGIVNLLRVQMEIGELENSIALLEDRLKTEGVRFNSILNRKPDTDIYIGDSLSLAKLPGSIAMMADSISNNPMIRMFEADREANEARIMMAIKMGYPMIGLGLNYSLIQKAPEITSMMNGKDMLMPMITATLPIYRKKYKSLQKEAGFLRDASAESVMNTRNVLTVSYREALQQYSDAVRRSDLYKRQASLAEKMIILLTKSFSSAGTDFEEILRTRQQLLDYEFRQIEALVDSNTAVATIRSIISYN